ncbi:hypothetical protein BDP55DRAFT_566577 [Colletotrichum godetiae]|uniref:BTB domain-containing protein n=1 Tax=Colletotrichum godetiae TaxID=1209918 RepID=A0AAJ0ELN8_9PEZI|nr:uncharacterized protein BDP55DRAFT_566577 [Colletotrichum godetiae]KAK1657765.1 hypothetical protein BDP55DRAFT_566577 [Colletotrichum godetiae]
MTAPLRAAPTDSIFEQRDPVERSHTLDPDGDVVLVLENANPAFALWEQCTTAGLQEVNLAADSPVADNGSVHPQTPEAETHPPMSSYDETRVQSPASTIPCVEFIVSSRHLTFSSHYFKAQLCGPWAEASVHSQDGRRHTRIRDWDADALILMQIFHAKTGNTPRLIDLEQLAKIAVLVDYFSCYNTVRFFSTLWIDALKEQLPSQCNRELVLWLFVAVVFRRDDIFQTITKTAVTESKGPLPTLGLPFRGDLIDQIDFRRQDAIAGILRTLDTLGTSLLRGLSGCDFGCSSALFGALAKEMAKHNLMDPEPCAPFLGYGITALEKAIKDFQTPRWGHSVYHASSSRPCQLVDICTKLLGEGLDEVKKGFTLSEVGLFRP